MQVNRSRSRCHVTRARGQVLTAAASPGTGCARSARSTTLLAVTSASGARRSSLATPAGTHVDPQAAATAVAAAVATEEAAVAAVVTTTAAVTRVMTVAGTTTVTTDVTIAVTTVVVVVAE